MRRKRSEMSIEDAQADFSAFAKKVVRMGETSDASMFTNPHIDLPAMGECHINVQLMVSGSFGVANDFLEAIRVLGGHKLPRATHPKD